MQNMLQKLRKNRKKGFTLVELIVVISILAVLAAILVPTMTGLVGDAKEATAMANTRTAYTAATAAWTYVNTHMGETGVTVDSKIEEYTGDSFDGTITIDPTTAQDGSVEMATVTWTGAEYTGVYDVATGKITVTKNS